MAYSLSNANPIQFWPANSYTFNNYKAGFVDNVPYYHQLEVDDIIKLQFTDTDVTKEYILVVTDGSQNILNLVSFDHVGTYYQIQFTPNSLPNPLTTDQCVLMYIAINDGSFTFDDTFDFTFQGILTNIIYQSDAIYLRVAIPVTAGWGSKIIQYQSSKNFAGIQYPNDSQPFFLRIPCRFFQERPKMQQNSIELSNNQIINTSTTLATQKLLTTTYLPDYMHKKIILALQHAVRGSVYIEGFPFIVEEAYDLSLPDPKQPMQMGKIWLTREDSMVRNVI